MGEKTGPSRRTLMARAGAAVAAPFVTLGAHQVFAASPRTYSTRAIDLVRRTTVIDMLAPLFLEFDLPDFSKPISDTARARFKASGVTGFHNSTGIGGPTAHEDVTAYIGGWSNWCGRNSDLFSVVGRVDDLDRAKREGKIAVIMGVQDSDHFREIKDVAYFYALGQRCSQITYNSQNLLGAGSTERVDAGLSDFGVAIVKEMNRVGMLVDASHCGEKTTLDIVEASDKPMAFTHTNCRALRNHPRTKTDEAIKKLAAKGGVMGVTGVRMFLSDKDPTTVENIVDHIDHVVKLTSIDHVGVGSDSDLIGYDHMSPAANKALRDSYKASYAFRDKIDTDGFDHPQRIFDLTEALIRRGYPDPHIEQVLGGNFRRLLAGTWL